MQLSNSSNKNRKRWHAKALLIDPHRTKIIIAKSTNHQPEPHVPFWVYRSLLGEQYGEEIGEGLNLTSEGCPRFLPNVTESKPPAATTACVRGKE